MTEREMPSLEQALHTSSAWTSSDDHPDVKTVRKGKTWYVVDV